MCSPVANNSHASDAALIREATWLGPEAPPRRRRFLAVGYASGGESLELQLQAVRRALSRLADRYEVEFVLDAASADAGVTCRPAFQRLLEALSAHQVAVVVVTHLDRLVPSGAERSALKTLFDTRSTRLWSLTEAVPLDAAKCEEHAVEGLPRSDTGYLRLVGGRECTLLPEDSWYRAPLRSKAQEHRDPINKDMKTAEKTVRGVQWARS